MPGIWVGHVRGQAQRRRRVSPGQVGSPVSRYVLCLSVGDNFYLYSVITPLPDLTRHAILTQTLTHCRKRMYSCSQTSALARAVPRGRRETTHVTPRMCACISVVGGPRASSGSIRGQRRDLPPFCGASGAGSRLALAIDFGALLVCRDLERVALSLTKRLDLAQEQALPPVLH